MTQRQAILLSVGLVLLVILVLHFQKQPDAEPIVPEVEVVEPDEPDTGAIGTNPITLYRNVASLVQYAKRMQVAFQLAADEMAKVQLPKDLPVVKPLPEPAADTWWHDATLVFYRPGQLAEAEANRMHRAGMRVYRVPNTRQDLYRQFRVTMVPTYITFQGGREIRRYVAACSTGGCP